MFLCQYSEPNLKGSANLVGRLEKLRMLIVHEGRGCEWVHRRTILHDRGKNGRVSGSETCFAREREVEIERKSIEV